MEQYFQYMYIKEIISDVLVWGILFITAVYVCIQLIREKIYKRKKYGRG